jgi:hypothetical protein
MVQGMTELYQVLWLTDFEEQTSSTIDSLGGTHNKRV